MMNVEYHYDDSVDAKVPCCPRFPSSHHLSADKERSYYCYECGEHYAEVKRPQPSLESRGFAE